MSKEYDDMRNTLTDFVLKLGPAAILPAKVLQVNDDDTVRIELSAGGVINDVRLKSVVKDGARFLLIPTVGSIVQVGRIQNSEELVVLAVDEITELRLQIGDTFFSVTAAGFLLKKENDTLRSLVGELIDACLQERHTTPYGPTVALTADSQTRFNSVKTKFENLLRNA